MMEKVVGKSKKVNRFVVFIISIFLFPVIIETISYLLNNGVGNIKWNLNTLSNLFNIPKMYMSFYATALTISFTVYSFNKQQEKAENDRRKDVEKDRELKIKELEGQIDYYRPTFVVEKDSGRELVKVLMRDENQYLEEIKYYSSPDLNLFIEHTALKSGAIVAQKTSNSFYISAKTQIGETILFGYLNGGVKIHKYLKPGKVALLPSFFLGVYNQEKVDAIWGTYNSGSDYYNKNLDQVFFYNTTSIREKISFNYYSVLDKTLSAQTSDDFFKNVFLEIVNQMSSNHFTPDSVYEALSPILNDMIANQDNFSIKDGDIKDLPYNHFRRKINSLGDKDKWTSLLDYKTFKLDKFLEVTSTSLHYGRFELDEKEMRMHYEALLAIMVRVVEVIKFNDSFNNTIYKFKADVINKLEY